jgi:hypothetical protein
LLQAVIVHSNPQVVKTLGAYLSKRGKEVLRATDPEGLCTLLDKNEGFSPILALRYLEGMDWRNTSQGSVDYSNYAFVRNALNHEVDSNGDKFAASDSDPPPSLQFHDE